MAKTKHDLRALLGGAHGQAAAALRLNRALVAHPSGGGAAAERVWLDLLNRHLPQRYRAAKAIVADAAGGFSHEIDVVVFDRLNTSILFENEANLYVPAESVQAVFEAKQTLNGQQLAYAARKIASVRTLKRRGRPRVLAGVLALDGKWREPGARTIEPLLAALPAAGAVDLGCIADTGIFTRAAPLRGAPPRTTFIHSEAAIALFLFTLAGELAALGPAAPVDVRAYAATLASGA